MSSILFGLGTRSRRRTRYKDKCKGSKASHAILLVDYGTLKITGWGITFDDVGYAKLSTVAGYDSCLNNLVELV